jgi:hypothetical protein
MKERVYELLASHEELLAEVPWASERARWHELLYCVLAQTAPDAQVASTALSILGAMNLTDPAELAALPSNGERPMVEAILQRLGYSDQSAGTALQQLAATGRMVQSQMGGKIQRFLRSHGERMRDEMVGHLVAEQVDPAAARDAVTHWLQTVLTMPVSFRHDSLEQLCLEEGGSIDEALGLADEIDLNVAALDHLAASVRSARATT